MAYKLAFLTLLATLMAAVAAGGCASKVPIRARGATGGVQGGAWELVVPGPEVSLALAASPEHPHYPPYMTRRDHALGATTPSWAPVGATGDAPTTIESQRSIYLRRSYDSFLFFTTPRPWTAPTPWWAEPPHGYPPPRYWEP